jgi:hypothetical protein
LKVLSLPFSIASLPFLWGKNRGFWQGERRLFTIRHQEPKYPSDLTDQQWGLIGPLIPPHPPNGKDRRTSMRAVVNAIFYINRGGCAWRMAVGNRQTKPRCQRLSTPTATLGRGTNFWLVWALPPLEQGL